MTITRKALSARKSYCTSKINFLPSYKVIYSIRYFSFEGP